MDKPEFRVERGPAATDEPFAVGMAKLLEREGRTIAAAELRRLHAQRDALLEALKSTGLFLHHCWCDVQMNDHSFEKLNRQMEIVDAAIKAVEETK